MLFSSKPKASPKVVHVCSNAITNTTEDNVGIELQLEARQSGSYEEYEIVEDNDNKKKKGAFDDAPAIVNTTDYPIVVFLERGVLFNKAVLLPHQALTLSKKQTGGILPYKVHAMIGNQEALPTQADSLKNLARVSVIPAAFVGGCLVAAATAGVLAGPSAALAPLVSGMVVKGVVIDTAAIAAGTMAADTAQKVASKLLQEHPETFMAVTGLLTPGRRYLKVTGGISEPLEIQKVSQRKFERLEIDTLKILDKKSSQEQLGEFGRRTSQRLMIAPSVEPKPTALIE